MAYKPDKHGRDHCPGGEDPLPCLASPWVRRKRGSSLDGGTSPSTVFPWGTMSGLEYDDGGDPDHDSIAGSPDWQAWFEIPNDFQTRVLYDGTYMVKGNVHWDDIDEAKTFLVLLHDGLLWPEGWTITGDPSWEAPSHMWQTWKRMAANNFFHQSVQFTGTTDEAASSWYIEVMRLNPSARTATGQMRAEDAIGDE